MKRRTLLAASATAPFLSGCIYPDLYEISYEEEVQLHDGSMIWVSFTRFWKRRSFSMDQYPKLAFSLGQQFSFDPGNSTGRFSYRFNAGGLNFLHRKNGFWYIGYMGAESDKTTALGSMKILPFVAILKPDGSIAKPNSWSEIPAEFVTHNVLPITPDPSWLGQFNGKKLSHAKKMAHWKQFPTGSDDQRIVRITPETSK
jgi:hypothetical protein